MGNKRRAKTNIDQFDTLRREMIESSPQLNERAMKMAQTGAEAAAYGRAYEQGINIPVEAELHLEEIWEGKAEGHSKADLEIRLDDYETMRAGLRNGALKPSEVIGKGYKGDTRKMAEEYVENQIAEYRQGLATRGRSISVNAHNTLYHLRKARTQHPGH